MPVGFLRLGGTCWIDDVLSVDPGTGTVVTNASTGMDVDPFTEAACQKFGAFMTEGGAGEQALSLLPLAIPLGDMMIDSRHDLGWGVAPAARSSVRCGVLARC